MTVDPKAGRFGTSNSNDKRPLPAPEPKMKMADDYVWSLLIKICFDECLLPAARARPPCHSKRSSRYVSLSRATSLSVADRSGREDLIVSRRAPLTTSQLLHHKIAPNSPYERQGLFRVVRV